MVSTGILPPSHTQDKFPLEPVFIQDLIDGMKTDLDLSSRGVRSQDLSASPARPLRGGEEFYGQEKIGGFPQIRGTILGVPIIRTIVYWGLYWGPPILGNYQFKSEVNWINVRDPLYVWGMGFLIFM